MHPANGPRTVLSAEPWDGAADLLVEGPTTFVASHPIPEAARPLVLTWGREARRTTEPGRVHEVNPQRLSCLATGHHGGTCSWCGTGGPPTNWEAAWDALLHAGSGAIASLEAVAQQVEPSRVAVTDLLRALESLSMIEVQRSPSLQPIAWRAAPASLAETASGSWAALGAWLPSALRDLVDVVRRLGGRAEQRPTGGLQVTVVSGVPAAALQNWIDSAEVEVMIVPDAAPAMAEGLPPLSQVEDGLLRMPVPGFSRAERFDPSKARWVSTDHVSSPGSYRLTSGFLIKHVYRGVREVEQGTVAIVDTYLAKHLAARDSGRLLLAYAEPSRRLVTPLGSRLPGLYDRAAVLSAASLPEAAPRRGLAAYREVPSRVADRLAQLLSC